MNGNRLNHVLGPLALLLLSACGGGGGGDTSTVDSSTTPLALTTDNAAAVTAEVLEGALSTTDLTVEPLPPVSLSVAGVPVSIGSMELLQRALKPVLDLPTEGLSGATGVSQTLIADCDSGSAKVTATVSNVEPYVPTPGDQLRIEANDCTFSEVVDGSPQPISIDGIATITWQEPSGFPPRADFPTHASWAGYSFAEQEQLQCAFNAFRITATGTESVSMTFDGNLLLKAGSGAANSLALDYGSMSGDFRLHLTSTVKPFDFRLTGIIDLEGLSRLDGNDFGFDELRYNASYGSHTLGGVGGRVSITTPDNLVHDGTSGDPLESGTLKVVGAAGSSVTATIPGTVSDLQLTVDSDGDGSIDRTLDLSWEELDAL